MSHNDLVVSNKGSFSDIAIHVWIACFCLPLILLGGSSQIAMAHTTLLWPLSALFLAPVLYLFSRESIKPGLALLTFLLCLALLMVFQLIPLPPSLWQGLPGRESLADLEVAIGVEAVWRPISWTPERTIDALLGLSVPLVALLLALTLIASINTLFRAVLLIATANVTLTVLQVLSGYSSDFYIYSVSSGRADGIFGNENHAGVFSALAMIICGYRGSKLVGAGKGGAAAIFYGAGFIVFLVCILVGGSRAALACAVLAALLSACMFYIAFQRRTLGGSTAPRAPQHKLLGRGLVFAALASMLITASLFVWLERSPSFDGIVSQDSFEDLRWELVPILLATIEENWIFGIGFGAFSEYYHSYEPVYLLMPAFVNQAHNDWAQLFIEGGAGAIALIIGLLAWFGKRLWTIWRLAEGESETLLFWFGVFIIIASASAVDYPLRTEIFQVSLIWLLLILSKQDFAADKAA